MFQAIVLLLANGFVLAFAVDAGVSLLDEIVRWATGSFALLPLRSVIAGIVAILCIPCLIALGLSPRLPGSIFLPLAISGLWLNLGAAPLPIWIDSALRLAMTACVIQLAVAGAALFAIRRRNRGVGWLLSPQSLVGPAFSLRHTLASILLVGFVLLPAAGIYSLVYVATALQKATDGFVVFDLAGVSLAERRFEQEDREIQLVGMIHIGEQSAYRDLFRSFATESTVVLAEGVTDDSNLMKTRLSYAGAAANLGLAPQRNIEEYLDAAREEASISDEWPHIQHADVDVATFSPDTLAFLESAAQMWSSDDLLAALVELSRDPKFTDPGFLETLKGEVLDDRNTQLLLQLFDATLSYQRVIVPWGALHLPAIEAEVLERGYTLRASKEHPLISWSALLAAVL